MQGPRLVRTGARGGQGQRLAVGIGRFVKPLAFDQRRAEPRIAVGRRRSGDERAGTGERFDLIVHAIKDPHLRVLSLGGKGGTGADRAQHSQCVGLAVAGVEQQAKQKGAGIIVGAGVRAIGQG